MKEHESSSSFRIVLWLSLGVIVAIARIVTDIIALASNTAENAAVSTLHSVYGASLILCSGMVIWSYANTHSYRNRQDFFSDFSRLLILLFASVLPFGGGENPDSLASIIFENIFICLRVFTTLYTVVFLYRALNLQRTSQTQKYTRVILIGTLVAFLTSFISSVSHERDLRVIVFLLAVVLSVIMYLAVKRRTWVLLLAAREKRRLLLLVFLGVIISITVAVSSFSDETSLCVSLHHSAYGFPVVMSYAAVFLGIFCERVFWTILFSLPNSSMVERRTFEFSSVAYLNRIAAESTDLNKLYDTVTSLAAQATRATAAWCFSCDEDNAYTIVATERVTPRQIDALNDSNVLVEFAKTLQAPVNVEYIAEHPTFGFLSRSVESFAQSMLVAPLRNGRELVGAVVVVHSQPFSFESDDLQAIGAFASSASVAIENARLVEDSLEKERYHRELMVGREIQKKLLPQSNPKLPGYEVFATSHPALEVGGDYYDFFELKTGVPCVLIADVSGKGISAAFYMAKLKGVSLALARHASSAEELVENINATLFGTMERQMYITLTAAHLADDGSVTIVRAGHTPAILCSGESSSIVKPKGLGIGLARPEFFNRCIRSESFQLKEDSALILFTDGINEARNSEGDEYGLERLENAVTRVGRLRTAETVAQSIIRDVNSFSNHSMQHDDMTLIVVRRVVASSTPELEEPLHNKTILEDIER